MIDSEMLASLGGRVVRLRGHRPLVLDDPSVMWLVDTGSAAIAVSRVEQGLPVGPRRFLHQVGAGSPLFAVTDRHRGTGNRLIVLSMRELTLFEIPLRRVDQALAAADVPFSAALESWVNKLSEFAVEGEVRPGVDRVDAEGAVGLDAGQSVTFDGPALKWVRVESGTVRLMGRPELQVPALPAYLPVGASMWLTAADDAELTVRTAISIAENVELVRGLSLFHALLQKRLRLLERADEALEVARLEERDTRHRQMLDRALDDMASALDASEVPVTRESALLGAAAAVGDELGIEIRPPLGSENMRRVRDPLEAIARASRVRLRHVLLTDRWWKSDCGPLIAYLKEDGRPVALIRTERRGYEIVDPIAKTRRSVDQLAARDLHPEATMLYRQLPATLRRPFELVPFSLRGRLGDLAFVAGLAALATIVGMLTPQAVALVLDDAVPDANRRLLLELGMALVAAAFGVALLGAAQAVISIRLGVATDSTTQSAVWDRVLRLEAAFFKRYSSGDLLARVSSVSDINRELNGQAMQSLLSSTMLLLNLGLLMYFSAELAVIAASLGVAIAVVTVLAGAAMRRHFRALVEMQGHFFGLVVQIVNAVGKIRVAGAEQRAFALWADRYARQLRLILKAQVIEDWVMVFNQTVPAAASILLFWFGVGFLGVQADPGAGGGALSSTLSVGIFLAFNTALGTFIAGATSVSNTVVELMDTLVKARRMMPLLDAKQEVGESNVDPGQLLGEIALTNITFRYVQGGEKVLDDTSVRADPGEFIALVGPSGSGKSTIFRLLLGFESPETGTVTFDGQNLSGLDVTAVRRQLGVVLQGGRISAGSVFENIAQGALISHDEAWEAAEDAGLADDLRDMPMGMHTFISQGGTNLSGGQRQRLSIARALAPKPRVLLLDEATSALDNRTQATVAASLERRKVTRVVIAHRLSTVRYAQRIYVLDKGRVVETGTFDQLVDRAGLFASLMARQVA